MIRHDSDMRWPTRFDYDMAMQDMHGTILDQELSKGRIASTKYGILHFEQSPGPVRLYRSDDWVVRCFCRDDRIDTETLEDTCQRYERLSMFYEQNKARVSSLVPVQYVERGIRVDFFDLENSVFLKTDVMPLVKMQYIEAPSLGTFVAMHYRKTQIMNLLCDAWLRMIREMEAVKMAHGDLDLTNVLVRYAPTDKQILLKLIDYDNTWIPGFDYALPEHGHEPFQHPSYFKKSYLFNHKIDRFAALVIYISLKAIALHSVLYKQFGADESRLLFSPTDYQAEQNNSPGRISQLRGLSISELTPLIEELHLSLQESRLPGTLDDIALLSGVDVAITKAIATPETEKDIPHEPGQNEILSQPRIKIIFCYAHEDEDLLKKLKMHLTPLYRQGLIDVWYDRDIAAGAEWERIIDQHLNTAHIILLLISPDFMASDYCYGKEMRQAMERHKRGEAKVIPVILHPVDWQETPIQILQALPRDGIPVTDPIWPSIHYALHDVEKGIKGVIKRQLFVSPTIT